MSSAINSLQVQVSNKQIFSIALPIAAAILVPQINFITNNIFLGRLDETALAVAGITGVFYLIFAAIGYGLNNGIQVLIARRAGENKADEIGKLYYQGLWISLGIAAVAILLTFTIGSWVLRQSLHDAAKIEMAQQFLYIRIWGLPFLYGFQMRNGLMTGTNNTSFLIVGTLAETLTNIFLDYGLIYGHFGMPRLGFNGAAYASVIAEGMGMLVMSLVIRWSGLQRRLQLSRAWAFDAATAKLAMIQSSPLIAQHAISIISWEFFYILIEHHGTRDLAISNAMRNVFGLFGCFAWAFAATCNTMVSNIMGQGLQHRVIELIWKICRISFSIALFTCILLNLFPQIFLSIYGQNEDFIIHALPVVRVVSIGLLCMSVSTIWLNAVTGTGNTKVNLLIEFAAILLYCIYVWLVLEKWKLSIVWGWGSEMIYWTTMFIFSYAYIKSGRWKGKKI